MIRVSSNNEWDTLEEVIVGRVEGARIPSEDPGLRMADFWHLSDSEPIPSGPFPERVVEETKEDLEVLAEALSSLGVIVHRPSLPQPERTYSSPHWSSDGLHSYCPRDTLLVVGDTIIETPMVQRSRQYETLPLRPILHECLRGGARWLSAPRPALLDDSWRRRNGFHIALNEHEPLFDAANVVRLGQDLLYLVSDSGNYLGARWLQSVLGSKYRVTILDRIRNTIHIDTTIVPVREGLVFVPAEFVRPDNLPEVLRDWEVVYFNEPVAEHTEGVVLGSNWMALNLLMVRPDLALVDRRQQPLIRALEKRGVNVLPLILRHSRSLGGGFHCVTLDLRRSPPGQRA